MPGMPSINIAPYRKAVVAVVGALTIVAAAIGEAVADGALDYGDGITIVAAIGTAAGVYQARNAAA